MSELKKMRKDNISDLDKSEIKREYLKGALNKYIKKEQSREIVIEILDGAKQSDIAKKIGVSRERIRQIFNKELKRLPETLEEDVLYRDIFIKYNFEKELFINLFKTDNIVYGYLENKYDKGDKSCSELIGVDYFDKDEEEIIKKFYKLITYNGLTVKEEKISLLMAILQTEATQYGIENLINEYNKVIEENNYNLEKIYDCHNIESVLSRQKNVIMSNKRRFRYYNYDLLTQEDVNQLREMLEVDDGAYYTDYFFEKNKELMNRINILDKCELYNLLKRLFANEKDIVFSNMPIVLIGYKTKEEFFKDKIFTLAPITLDEFSKLLSQEYGHQTDSLKAYISKYFGRYITKGIINTEDKEFTEGEINLIKNVLTRDIYAIKEVKEILFELLNKDCSEYIKTVNFEKVNFKIGENYIVRTGTGSIEEVVRKELLKEDIFDVNETKLKVTSSFSLEFYGLIKENKLIKFADNKYYTTKGLEKKNINIEIIEKFKKEVYQLFEDEEIFTIYTIQQKGILENYQELNINKVFLECIIKTIEGIKNTSIMDNVAFLKSNREFFNKADFVEKIMLDNELTKVGEIKDFLKTKYDINVEAYKLKELINLKKYDSEDEKEIEKDEQISENESIENASADYNLMMVLRYIEKIFGLGVHKKYGPEGDEEFLKRFDNSLNTLNQKEKRIAILRNGLKDGKILTVEETVEMLQVVSKGSIAKIEKRAIEKLREEKRTGILRRYLDFSNNKFEDATADYILNLLK